ncbi:MAG: adenosylmethionine--8-amino-7-oxononanoate transaminase [Lentisphaeria bacterium]|nr:adenosylmethionine--8-amino-7-oxononanoate transaminase [Lentisphaeria bacterium]
MTLAHDDIAALDKHCVWHPFTQMQDWTAGDPIIIERAQGVRLVDIRGDEYYDGVSSLWLNIHGHRVPEIDAAIRDQLDRVAHSTLLGLANIPSTRLAAKLAELTPAGLNHVFYSDSGSESVEIALKMAYQYWRLLGQERSRFIKMTNAYHGDTIGAVSAGGIDLFHSTYRDLLFPTFEVPYPYPYRFDGSVDDCAAHCLAALDDILTDHAADVAGLIVEPLVQGAAGMIMMPEGFLKALEQRCHDSGVLLITDEVATGSGRTGRMFACDHEDVCPDIMTLAKGLTGGYLPLAATVTSEAIFEAFLGEYNEQKTFFHGHSYTGNQLCCAAALASLELFETSNLLARVNENHAIIRQALAEIAECEHVGEVRNRGFMTGIELVHDRSTREPYAWQEQIGVKVCDRSRELGMIVRPLGHVVIFMPPLASTAAELQEMLSILHRSISEVTE